MLPVTPEDSIAFHWYLSDQVGARWHNKGDSEAMAWAAARLEDAGILSAEVFLNHYATTIGEDVFLTSPPGTRDPWSEIVLATHEAQHILQRARDPINYEIRYLSDVAARVSYEVEAYRAGMEVDYPRRGAVRSPAATARALQDYGASPHAQEIARIQLETAAGILFRGGGPTTEAARLAVPWLQSRDLLRAG